MGEIVAHSVSCNETEIVVVYEFRIQRTSLLNPNIDLDLVHDAIRDLDSDIEKYIEDQILENTEVADHDGDDTNPWNEDTYDTSFDSTIIYTS